MGSAKWWNGPEAKQKRDSDNDDLSRDVPTKKKVRYEKRFMDGGAQTFHGPSLVPGDSGTSTDYTLYYYCKARLEMVPVPRGFIVIEEDDQSDPFAIAS